MKTGKMGLNKQYIKEQNRGKILELIATDKCNTRIELSKVTGLSKMAVSSIVSGLIASGIIEESEKDLKEGQGRNPIKLRIASTAPKIVGVLIFRGYCEAILCELNLNIIKREWRSMDRVTPENFIGLIYSLLDTVILDEKNIIGIGVASIGPIGREKGMILSPYYFYGIHDVPVVERIKERYGLPVFFDHDNQSGILAEMLFGNGQNYKDILLVGVSEGVGCGIITDNNLYENRNGLSPELGHVSIDYNGAKCLCGSRGCLETYIRTPSLLDKLQKITGKYYSYEQFCEIADEDGNVNLIFRDVVEKMSIAIVNGLNILNSEIVLIAYDCIHWKDSFVEELQERINERKFSNDRYFVKVQKTYFGKDSQLFGAACNVIWQIFKGNLLFEEIKM